MGEAGRAPLPGGQADKPGAPEHHGGWRYWGSESGSKEGTEPEGGKGLPEKRPGKQLNNQLE